MNILAVTRHDDLVERLKTCFEGAGHRVHALQDQLQALASEAWTDAHLMLVDAMGDPLDGIRLCALLRGESRLLFQNLPIFLILDQPLAEGDAPLYQDAHADGIIYAGDGIQRLLNILGPALENSYRGASGPPVPLLAANLSPRTLNRVEKIVSHFGYALHAASDPEPRQDEWQAPLMLLGLDAIPTNTLATIMRMREHPHPPYIILAGKPPALDVQRKLLLSGVMDWIPLPLSPPRLLHACRRGMEWLHMKRIQREFQFQLNDLREHRLLLEMETSALRNEVLTDPLTGLLNRRAFNQNLENAFNQWQRHHRPFVLILGDLDYFKLINDRFGHIAGDHVLMTLGERMRRALRRSDLAFRIGGEEFAVLLSETQLHAGAEVAEKLRRRIDSEPITLETGQAVFPTMSFGVGAPAHPDLGELFMAVDQALYIAKHKGRNRVEVIPDVTPPPAL
jgi:diguanylate cyclase (GGDEF)-like protein